MFSCKTKKDSNRFVHNTGESQQQSLQVTPIIPGRSGAHCHQLSHVQWPGHM
jgi:hypothetical protein